MSSEDGKLPDRQAVREAQQRLGGRIRYTPVLQPGRGTFGLDLALTLKLECLQHTGTFKARGSLNTLLSVAIPEAGVITASGGNHGQALAWAAREVGAEAEIFVPEVCPEIKRNRIASYGATVRVEGEIYDDAQDAANKRAAESGALMVHPFNRASVIAGQGTCGLEFAAQARDLDTVLVAVGGGGLISGVTLALSPEVKIVAVEPDTSQALHAALKAGGPVEVPVSGVAADSLGARTIGAMAYEIAMSHVVTSVTVRDEAITESQSLLWSDVR
ncbi:MAG: serine/threonine dehydratase, partial [Acidimicrobiales bacterium]